MFGVLGVFGVFGVFGVWGFGGFRGVFKHEGSPVGGREVRMNADSRLGIPVRDCDLRF